MERKIFKTTGWGALALIAVMSAAWQGQAQDAKASYSSMASIDQYLMTDRNAEIALARNAAPEAISREARILILARHGYETGVEGKNGWVCVVERSWMSHSITWSFGTPNSAGRSASIRPLHDPSCPLLTGGQRWYWRDCPKLG
jgi:hypothetical protein